MARNILVVVAHPDDEVLGFGGTAWHLTQAGFSVRTCVMSGAVNARDHRPADDELVADTQRAAELLGMQETILGPFPNIQMNSVPHLELVQFVEQAMVNHQANWLVTHHPHDQNDDHRQTSSATQAAARLSQRGQKAPPLEALMFMEVPSSTDWQFGGTSRPFDPNAFFPIGEPGLHMKLEALAAYRDVMRPFPHPRSTEVIRGLAAVRGGQSGRGLAEAFQVAHLDIDGLLSR